jgi:hypothetical protein
MVKSDLLDRQRIIIKYFRKISLDRSEIEAEGSKLLEESKKQSNTSLITVKADVEAQINSYEQKIKEMSWIYKSMYKVIHGDFPFVKEQKEAYYRFKEAEIENKRCLGKADAINKKSMTQARQVYDKSIPEIIQFAKYLSLESDLMGAPWSDSRWKSWSPPKEYKEDSYVRIGTIVEKDRWNSFSMPALLSLIGGHNIVIKVSGDVKGLGVQAVRSIILRLLVMVPPAKLRLILIDPVGHGQNLATFLRLSDYNKELVMGEHIWTEPQHIEEQLTRLTEHMEFIIQTFLRDGYKTIEEYNTFAKEIAEPYRLLVILDFPVNFTETSARRLASIVLNGPRCGIYTVITINEEKNKDYHWI